MLPLIFASFLAPVPLPTALYCSIAYAAHRTSKHNTAAPTVRPEAGSLWRVRGGAGGGRAEGGPGGLLDPADRRVEVRVPVGPRRDAGPVVRRPSSFAWLGWGRSGRAVPRDV